MNPQQLCSQRDYSASPNSTPVIGSVIARSSQTATASKADRNPALDFTKGALVLFMVLYHWLNYFVAPQGDFYRYIRFVTPSFIFITGFLISNVYLSRYQVSDLRLSKRLIQRGLKILGVFICLNLIISFLFQDSYSGQILFGQWSVRNMVAIFITGNTAVAGSGKAAAFYILVPISYLLLLSAGLVIVYRAYKHVFHAVCGLFLLGVLILRLNGLENSNLELLAIGLLGVIFGYIPIEKINNFVRHPYALAASYLGYTIAITIWNANYPLQIVGTCLSVMVLYLLGDKNGGPGRMRRHVILLGNYSLFGYIAQIAVLQLLFRGLRHTNLGASALPISFFAAFALTMLSVEAMDRARAKSATVAGLYKAVFS